MIVDTSAIMAILLREPEMERFFDVFSQTIDLRMSAANYVELTIASSRRAIPIPQAEIEAFLAGTDIVIEPVTVEQARLAREAYLTYGRGHHPAALNFGDCFAYALAKATGKPLLFKGDDFGLTDVEAAG